MKRAAAFAAVTLASVAWLGSAAFAAPQTWVGYVSDSQCGSDHGGEIDPKECTIKCVQAGDKYVLVVDRGTTVVPIANQDFPALRENAGEEVKVTGELSDGAIVIAKIEKP